VYDVSGPYGGAFLYVHDKWIAGGVALEEHEHFRLGAGSSSELPFTYRDAAKGIVEGYTTEYAAGALRFGGGGRPNPILIPMVQVRCQNHEDTHTSRTRMWS